MVKVPLSAVPRPLTAAMMAMAMPVAIRPYSIAVAPDSFFRKLTISCYIVTLPRFHFPTERRYLAPVPVVMRQEIKG